MDRYIRMTLEVGDGADQNVQACTFTQSEDDWVGTFNQDTGAVLGYCLRSLKSHVPYGGWDVKAIMNSADERMRGD